MKIVNLMQGLIVISLVLSPQVSSTAQDSAGDEMNGLITKLAELGFNKCLTKMNDITNFLIDDGEHSAVFFYDTDHAQDNLVSFTLGRGGDNQNYLATIDFSQNEHCSASYELTRVWVDSCDEVMNTRFSDYQDPRDLHGGFTVLSRGENLHVAVRALPSTGCLTVQKEIIF